MVGRIRQHGTTWFGQPVTFTTGTLVELRRRLPLFTRQPFGTEDNRNEHLETILREPFGGDNRRIPVAAVAQLALRLEVVSRAEGAAQG